MDSWDVVVLRARYRSGRSASQNDLASSSVIMGRDLPRVWRLIHSFDVHTVVA